METGKAFCVRALAIWMAGAAVGCAADPSLQRGHHYGDLEVGSVDNRFRDGGCETGELDDLLEPYMWPEMMAIGDSLYNGVRALRVNWWLAEWSAPTMTAMALGLVEIDEASKLRTGKREFYVPRYPGHPAYHGGEGVSTLRRDDLNIGFDLESVSIRQTRRYLREQARTLKALADRPFAPPEGRPVNDNLAFFSADATDLLTLTGTRADEIMSRPPAGRANGRSIAELRDTVAAADEIDITDLVGSFGWMGDAAFYGNAGFVLNPLGLDCLARMSSIDQVAARKPRRLLINIGANHGIYRVAFDGYDIDMVVPKLREGGVEQHTIRRELDQVFLDSMQKIVDRLARIEGLEHVYINALPRPSYAANLVPVDGTAWPQRAPGLHKYYRQYRPYLTFSGSRQLSAKQVEEADVLVRRVNDELRKLLDETNAELDRKDDRKFILVETDQLLDRYDAKHTGDAAHDGLPVQSRNRLIVCSRHLTNLPLKPAPGGTCDIEFSQGGIFSMDNMHLSTPGYGALADLVANTVAQAEGVNLSQPGAEAIKPAELFSSDALKQDIFLRNATTFGGNLAAISAVGDVAAFVNRAFLREPRAGAVPAAPAPPSSSPSGRTITSDRRH